jgi:hypothetical protein
MRLSSWILKMNNSERLLNNGDYSLFKSTSYARRLELILIIVGTACHCLV